jgi:hypothetical protein
VPLSIFNLRTKRKGVDDLVSSCIFGEHRNVQDKTYEDRRKEVNWFPESYKTSFHITYPNELRNTILIIA